MYRGCDPGTLQEGEEGLTDIIQGGGGKAGAGDQEQVQPRSDVREEGAHRLTQ